MEKELSALGEGKKGSNEIFRHCRGFERAYSVLLQVCSWRRVVGKGSYCTARSACPCAPSAQSAASPYSCWQLGVPQEAHIAFKIRAVVEGNLPETLRRIPIERRFNKNYVREVRRRRGGVHRGPAAWAEYWGCHREQHTLSNCGLLGAGARLQCMPGRCIPRGCAHTLQVCREADGYQAHLVSPERGIRRLVAEAMSLTNEHVHRFVDDVHMVLMETVGGSAGLLDWAAGERLSAQGVHVAPGALPRLWRTASLGRVAQVLRHALQWRGA